MPPSAREFLPALCLLLVIALWISGCGDADLKLDSLPSCPSPSVCITIRDVTPDNPADHFEPRMTTVSAGTTVFLSYNGFQEHDLTFITVNQQGNTIFTSDPDCPPNVTISYHCSKIFDPGTYRFFCTLHQDIDDAAELIVNNP